MDRSTMEQIIANLLVADNAVIQKATIDLQKAFETPAAIPALCQVIESSTEPQHRHRASVLLRKRLKKLTNWQLLSVEHQEQIKNGMLNVLVNERDKLVRNAIAKFVGTIMKHNTSNEWMSQVLKFVFDHCSSADPQQSEMGSSVFATLAATAPDQFVPHLESVCGMFSTALAAAEQNSNLATPVILNILQAMCQLMPFIQGYNNVETTVQRALPYIAEALQGFSTQDPEQFIKAFDILESITNFTPKLLNANLKLFVDFCFGLAINAQLSETVRIRAATYIARLVRFKKEAILKRTLIEPIIEVVFTLMTTAPEDELDDYYWSTEPTAEQTMDKLALDIPSAELLPPLLALLDSALTSGNPLYKRAAYLSIAVIADRCSESIRRTYLRPLLNWVKVGIVEQEPIVRNAAFSALVQFSKYLQPAISKYASEILPIMLQLLQSICDELREGKPEPKHFDRMFYALEIFCVKLEEPIVPYLPSLLERLFEMLHPNNSVKLREWSLLSIATVAGTAKTDMLPYFPQLIEVLKMYLVKTDNEDIISLRRHAIELLATLARNIGKENFMPLANETMNFALTLLDEADSKLRTSLYNLLAALSEVVTVEMASFLPNIVGRMVDSVKSSKKMVKDNDEKEEAILALKSLAEFTGPCFTPFIQPCFEAIYVHLDHPQSFIRKVAIEALSQFVITLFQLNDLAGSQIAVAMIIPKFAELLQTNEEYDVVIRVFEAYLRLLENMKSHAVFNEELKSYIFSCVTDVMSTNLYCQIDDSTGEEDDDDIIDYSLVELAGQVFPALGGTMHPTEFAMYIGSLWPLIQEKCETVKAVFYAEEKAFETYAQELQALSPVAPNEEHVGLMGNRCDATVRLCNARSQLIRMKKMLTVFVEDLPLREDFQENKAAFESMQTFLTQNVELLQKMLDRVRRFSQK